MQILFTVRDSKTGAYFTPFFAATDLAAIRSLRDAVNDPQTIMYKHPEDFEMYEIGVFDEHSGELVAEESPKHVTSCLALVERVRLDQLDLPFEESNDSGNKRMPTVIV